MEELAREMRVLNFYNRSGACEYEGVNFINNKTGLQPVSRPVEQVPLSWVGAKS